MNKIDAIRDEENEFKIHRYIGRKVTMYNPSVLKKVYDEVIILSVTTTHLYTRIDFMYESENIAIPAKKFKANWRMYIQPKDTDIKYYIYKAEDVIGDLVVRWHYCKHDKLYFFSFYFPPLPARVQDFDFISGRDDKAFNIYGISVEKKGREQSTDFSDN